MASLSGIFCLLIFLSALPACRYLPVEYEPVTTNGLFRVELPGYLSMVNDLNPDAALQVANPVREVFFIVLASPKRNAIAPRDMLSLFRFAVGNITSELKDWKVAKPEATQVNGLTAIRSYLTGNLKGSRVKYSLMVVEGRRRDYQVLGWTLESRAKFYQPHLDRIFDSFEELAD